MDEIIAKIKGYLKIINNTEIDDKLLDFVICEVLDRVKLYLNSETIPTNLERILSNVINTGLKKCLKDMELASTDATAVDRVVTSISDNGQSISYANEVTRYFTTVSDEELFTGFTPLLSRYRRVKVVYPKSNEERNS